MAEDKKPKRLSVVGEIIHYTGSGSPSDYDLVPME